MAGAAGLPARRRLAAVLALSTVSLVQGMVLQTTRGDIDPSHDEQEPTAKQRHRTVLSPGCRTPLSRSLFSAGFENRTTKLEWSEPGLPTVNRTYGIYVPHTYDHSEPISLLFVFHGWGEDTQYHQWYDFGRLARRKNFVAVYPLGLGDCNTPDCEQYSSWNGVGTSGSNDTWATCDPSVQVLDTCYDSCRIKKGKCHQCDWSTCYNDVGFIAKLLGVIQDNLCIDRTRIFASGCSNGGMFVHELPKQMPGVFAGIVASCGGKPHIGFMEGLPKDGPPIAVATIVGNADDTLPRNGTHEGRKIWDGYWYVPEKEVLQTYKDYNKCGNKERRRYGAGLNAHNMTCWEEGFDCAGGVSVSHCLFNGPHDFNNGTGANSLMDDPEFTWEFLSSHPLQPEFVSGSFI